MELVESAEVNALSSLRSSDWRSRGSVSVFSQVENAHIVEAWFVRADGITLGEFEDALLLSFNDNIVTYDTDESVESIEANNGGTMTLIRTRSTSHYLDIELLSTTTHVTEFQPFWELRLIGVVQLVRPRRGVCKLKDQP